MVPLCLSAKSAGRSTQPCKHPQLSCFLFQSFSKLYAIDQWLVLQICHFSTRGNIEAQHVCRLSFLCRFGILH